MQLKGFPYPLIARNVRTKKRKNVNTTPTLFAQKKWRPINEIFYHDLECQARKGQEFFGFQVFHFCQTLIQ